MGEYQDFTMSYLIKDSVAYLTRTADRYRGNVEDSLNRQSICSISPSKFTAIYSKCA